MHSLFPKVLEDQYALFYIRSLYVFLLQNNRTLLFDGTKEALACESHAGSALPIWLLGGTVHDQGADLKFMAQARGRKGGQALKIVGVETGKGDCEVGRVEIGKLLEVAIVKEVLWGVEKGRIRDQLVLYAGHIRGYEQRLDY
jgi:hypothetical protein